MASILYLPQCVNSYGADAGIFKDNLVSTMAADALMTSVARTSAAMILTPHRTNGSLLFLRKDFQYVCH